MALTNAEFEALQPGQKVKLTNGKKVTIVRFTGTYQNAEYENGHRQLLTAYDIAEIVKPDPFAAQRPEVQAKMRQLLGIYQSLTVQEQIFIKGILINLPDPENKFLKQ